MINLRFKQTFSSIKNTQNVQEAFDKLKSVITSAPVLAYFDQIKETVLSVGLESSTLKRFKDSSSAEWTSKVVKEYVFKGWPSEKEQVDEFAREY